MINTAFLEFWRELPLITLGLAWRVWCITRDVGEAARIVAPTRYAEKGKA